MPLKDRFHTLKCHR